MAAAICSNGSLSSTFKSGPDPRVFFTENSWGGRGDRFSNFFSQRKQIFSKYAYFDVEACRFHRLSRRSTCRRELYDRFQGCRQWSAASRRRYQAACLDGRFAGTTPDVVATWLPLCICPQRRESQRRSNAELLKSRYLLDRVPPAKMSNATKAFTKKSGDTGIHTFQRSWA